MNTNVYFKDMQALPHLQEFVDESLDKAIAKFEKTKPFHLKVFVRAETTRRHTRNPLYSCEILLSAPYIKGGTVFIKKAANNFHKAVKDAARSVENILKNESRKKSHLRRKEQHPELQHLGNQVSMD